jgi:hypothetical protein
MSSWKEAMWSSVSVTGTFVPRWPPVGERAEREVISEQWTVISGRRRMRERRKK